MVKRKKELRGTPTYTVRLKPSVQAALDTMGKMGGFPNGRVFVRSLLTVIATGDAQAASAFLASWSATVQGQLLLSLESATGGQRPAQKARKRRGRGRRPPAA